MKEYIERENPVSNHTLAYNSSRQKPINFTPNPRASYWRVSALITDNTASTVQQTLQNLNCDVNINRQVFWEIETDSNKNQILKKNKTDVKSVFINLFNPSNKQLRAPPYMS